MEQEHFFPKCIQSSNVIAYEDLGAEAVRRLEIKEFPVIVVIDSNGIIYMNSGITIQRGIDEPMNRIFYMVVRNFYRVPVWFYKIWKMGIHKERYTLKERYDYIRNVVRM